MNILDHSRFHLFSMDGTHILIGHKGGLYQIDEAAFDLLNGKRVSPLNKKRLIDEFAMIESLEGNDNIPKPVPERKVRALCLNVTRDCNMSCTYCFTRRQKTTSSHSPFMNISTAKKAIQFLVQNSLDRAPLQIDFFGGEPLLNFEVVRKTVAFAKKISKDMGRKMTFTLTTNGSLLDEKIGAFLDREGFQVILSLDGVPEIHNAHRPFRGGSPSWDEVFWRIERFLRKRNYKNYYIRGTFTHQSLNIEETARYFISHNLLRFSLEPARGALDEPWAVKECDLPLLFRQYENLTRLSIEHYHNEKPFDFFHFNIFQEPPLCITRRLCGCGAGVEYLSISPDGEIFPCHQLHGELEFSMGSVFDEIMSFRFKTVSCMFLDLHILNKQKCRQCWARYYCSGGCHANNYFACGNIREPDMLGCSLQKKRLECALWIQARQKIDKKEKLSRKKETPRVI